METNIVKYQLGDKFSSLVTKLNTPIHKEQIDKNWPVVSKLYNDAKKRGLSNSQIAALLGNITVETMGSFDPKQKQLGGGPGTGVIQLEKGTERHKDFLAKVNNPHDLDNQYGYVLDSFYNENPTNSTVVWGGYGNQDKWVKNPNLSVSESTKLLSDLYFRPGKPNIKERQKAAEYIHSKLEKDMIIKPNWLPAETPKIKTPLIAKQKKGGTLTAKNGGVINYDISNILSQWKK